MGDTLKRRAKNNTKIRHKKKITTRTMATGCKPIKPFRLFKASMISAEYKKLKTNKKTTNKGLVRYALNR